MPSANCTFLPFFLKPFVEFFESVLEPSVKLFQSFFRFFLRPLRRTFEAFIRILCQPAFHKQPFLQLFRLCKKTRNGRKLRNQC